MISCLHLNTHLVFMLTWCLYNKTVYLFLFFWYLLSAVNNHFVILHIKIGFPIVIPLGLNGALMVLEIKSRLTRKLNNTSSSSVWFMLTKWKGHSLKWKQPSPEWDFLTTTLMSYPFRGQKYQSFNTSLLFEHLRQVLFWIYLLAPFCPHLR